jgi:hypothetical protein
MDGYDLQRRQSGPCPPNFASKNWAMSLANTHWCSSVPRARTSVIRRRTHWPACAAGMQDSMQWQRACGARSAVRRNVRGGRIRRTNRVATRHCPASGFQRRCVSLSALPQGNQDVNRGNHRQARIPKTRLHQQFVAGWRFAARDKSGESGKKQHGSALAAKLKDKRVVRKKRDLTRTFYTQGRASSTKLNGVSVARRKRVKPPPSTTTLRSRFSPA